MKNTDIYNAFKTFTDDYDSIILASNPNDYPYASYAPVVKQNDKFYILVSKMAPHYKGLEMGKVAGLFIEDEKSAKNIFFRKRLHYVFESKICNDRDIKKLFIINFGEIAEVVLKLDFNIFELTIIEGTLVLGPGQAYKVDSSNKLILK